MKFYTSIIATIIMFSSCSSGKEESVKTADFSAEEFPMVWELQEFSTMMANSQVTGEDLPYQENYIFEEDNSFTKTRIENGRTVEAEGQYSKTSTNGEDYFYLVYENPNELVENCSGNEKSESLIIDSPQKIRGTANACDYPSKTYKRVK